MTGGVVRDGWRVREVVPGPRGFTWAVIVFRRLLQSSSRNLTSTPRLHNLGTRRVPEVEETTAIPGRLTAMLSVA